mmetsp:Transcript_20071/g.46048  ORF Transcript_20071/g.46048 Transcript_20071/m.46048 type:complete len:842 (+) Transcript_20071:99-2624(+)
MVKHLSLVIVTSSALGGCDGFLPSSFRGRCHVLNPRPYYFTGAAAPQVGSSSNLGLFRDLLKRVRNGDPEGDDDEENGEVENAASDDCGDAGANEDVTASTSSSTTDEKVDDVDIDSPKPTAPSITEVEGSSINVQISKAEKLRSQARVVRLEAQKREVELTLEKIEKVNSRLDRLKTQEDVDPKDKKSLEEELSRLKSQLITDKKGRLQPASSSSTSRQPKFQPASSDSSLRGAGTDDRSAVLTKQELERRVQIYDESPEFMKVLVAKVIGYGVDDATSGSVDKLNSTEIVEKLWKDEVDYEKIITQMDFPNVSDEENARAMLERAYTKSNGDSEFTDEQIKAKVDELDELPGFVRGLYNKEMNDTEMAVKILEDERDSKNNKGGLFGLLNINDKGSGLFGERNETGNDQSDLSLMVESLFPTSTRKEDSAPDEKKVDAFLTDAVVPSKTFSPTSKPLPVVGGWIVRGENLCSSGDELIEKLDNEIAGDARLRDSISFFLIKDPFPDPEDQMQNPTDWPQVLFVTGPDVARDPQMVLRSFVSSLGIATAWYGAIYPFLINTKLFDKAEEAMTLADAGMSTDLSWLSSLSIPVFVTFMSLQFSGEVAHQLVARSKGFEISLPTLVPSIFTGLTSSITSLKSPPKNKQDLLDFAVAGPLTGLLGSLALLCYGLLLTSTSDANTLQYYPGLPLLILRQSSLGGGLVELFLGAGTLQVPSSLEGTQALSSTMIALHPFCIAGYFSLMVNALALVPAGRTDGGRISQALFGRSGSQAVTFASLAALAILGFTSSDLLLFYFAFIAFFQSELEIPQRNEVDDVEFSRVLVAGFAGFLMLLTLIPMQ